VKLLRGNKRKSFCQVESQLASEYTQRSCSGAVALTGALTEKFPPSNRDIASLRFPFSLQVMHRRRESQKNKARNSGPLFIFSSAITA
jgi:hypothetical protein